ncbi:MAG: Ig-like domain-containing protein [Spirosomataceae bacterium]
MTLLVFYTSWATAQTIPSPTQTGTVVTDPNGNNKAEPGDRIRYKVPIQNTGGVNATGVQLNVVPDPKTTLVPGSFRTSPLAINDSYACTGNVGLSVPAANGLKSNDFDDNAALLTVLAETKATAQNGSVTLSTDGSFTYTPPAGYTGNDSFTYTLEDGNEVAGVAATDAGTVTLTISNMIWFVDNSSVAATSDGRLTSPFKTLADFNAASGPAVGQVIFLKNTGSDYTGGIILKNNQLLYGTGHSGGSTLADVLPFTVAAHSFALPAINGTRPGITNSGGDGITLASDNSLRGVDISSCSDFGIDDNGDVGALTISELTIVNTTGGGFRADNGSGSMNVVITTISTTGGINGINLTNCAGSFTVGGGTITNPTGTGVLISGGSVNVTANTNITDNSGFAVDIDNHDSGTITFQTGTITSTGQGIRVQNCGGGTITFSGTSKSLNTTSNKAVTLSSNSGAIINFTNGGLVITTTNVTGFDAAGGGTIQVTGTGNTINSGTGTALNVANTTIGASNLSFQSISSNGGSATGIILDNTGSLGGLTITGDGTNTAVGGNSSGGTIANKTGLDGSTTTGCGIYLNNTRNVVLRRMTINGANQNFGILGTTVNGFELSYSTVGGSLPANQQGNNDGQNEGSIRFTNLTGSANFTNDNISGAVETNVRIENSSGTLNRVTFSGTTVGLTNTTTGDDGIFIEAAGSSVLNSTITNCVFTGARGDWLQVSQQAAHTGSMDISITNNQFSNSHPNTVSGGAVLLVSLSGASGSSATYNINGNTLRDSKGTALAVSGGNNGVSSSGSIENNTIGVAGSANSGSDAASGIAFVVSAGGTHTTKINNNTIRQYNNHGILCQVGDQMGNPTNVQMTVTNNNITQPGNINTDFNGFHLNHGVLPTDNFTSCLHLAGNVLTGSGNGAISPNNQEFRVRQRQSTTIRLPGYAGANNDDAAVIAFLRGQNTVTAGSGAVSNTVPTGGGFAGGAACPTP